MRDASSTAPEPMVVGGAPVAETVPVGEAETPPGSPEWLPLVGLWPTVTVAVFTDLAQCFGESSATWPTVESWLVASGRADAVPGSRTAQLRVREEWLTEFGPALGSLLDSADARARLLGCAQKHGEPALGRIAGWALAAERWDVLHDLWRVVADDAANIPSVVLAVYTDVPRAARKQYPTLTWASAVARADVATPRSKRTEVFLNRMIRDSALLHADWAQRDDTDTAVFAGILRMVGERHLPPSGGPLSAAWRTKDAIERYIDERSRAGNPPTQLAHSFFRVLSAQLAVYRADLAEAVVEANWGGILALGPSTSDLAAGVESLARSLAGSVRPPDGGRARSALPPKRFRFGCLSQMAAVMSALARGREALETLDRPGVEAALSEVDRDTAAIAGVWATRVGIEAMHAAIWGDAPQGLNRLFASLADQPMGLREQDEPMSSLMLGPARALLLSRVGAFGAATRCTDLIEERFRSVPLASTLLWSGQLVSAVRTMELTLPDPRLLHRDRLQLLVIRGAATALDGSITEDIRSDTLMAVRHLLLERNYLAFATLPNRASQAVLELASGLADDPEIRDRFAELRRRLQAVRDGDNGAPLVQLTERETVLLPLLAGKASVPEIAKELQVSPNTVRSQVATLRDKFQASTRAELVRKAGAYGALPELP